MLTIEDVSVQPPAVGETVDPMAWFDSPGPLEVEIGCGKGGFLLHRARAHPQRRFLGIEWAGKYYRFCADRMVRWNVRNVRVMRTDAKALIMNHLPRNSVRVFHIYHPDPWPKKRHHKRRLISVDFVEAVVRTLTPGGTCRIQSDHEEYFHVMETLFGHRPELVRIGWEEGDFSPDPDWRGTNYEIKHLALGRPVLRAAFQAGRSASQSVPVCPGIEGKAARNNAAGRTN